MTGPPQFSIVTPSFRNSDWLKLCIASVADQGVALEHIVQDACSDDGTQDWLPHDPRVQAFIEKDGGMYDAVNRGFARARGEILAYLNCDEQYLPGALPAVADFFQAHPDIEVVFANAVVIDAEGRYQCDRRSLLPTRVHSLVSGNLSILTAATFYRRSVIERRGLRFSTELRAVSDALWVVSLVEAGVPMGLLDRFTSAFTETGANFCLSPVGAREQAILRARAPRWAQLGRRCVVAHYRLRRLLAGHYRRRPGYAYDIYTRANPSARVHFQVDRPVNIWRRQVPGKS